MVSNKPSSSCDHSSPRLSLDLLARQMSRLALRSVPLPRAYGSLQLVRRYIPSRLGLLLRSHEGTWPGYQIQFSWISMYRVALWDTQISLSQQLHALQVRGKAISHTGPEGVPLLKMPVYLSHRVESTHATFFQAPRQRQKRNVKREALRSSS
jgi:hypothetical protein